MLLTIILICIVGPWLVILSLAGFYTAAAKIENYKPVVTEPKPYSTRTKIMLSVLAVLILIKFIMGV